MEAAADVQVTKAAERFAAKEAEDLRREREEAAPTRHPLAVFQKCFFLPAVKGFYEGLHMDCRIW